MNTAIRMVTVEPSTIYLPAVGTVENFGAVLDWAKEILIRAQREDSAFDGQANILAGDSEPQVLENMKTIEQQLVSVFEELNGRAFYLDQRDLLDNPTRERYEAFREVFGAFYDRVLKYKRGLERLMNLNSSEAVYA